MGGTGKPSPRNLGAMNKLVIANLLHRPLRSIISVLAVAIEVIMILSIVGIFMGMLNDQKERTNGIGADLMLRPSNASYMNGVGGATMPVKFAEALRKLPHVAVVSPVNAALSTKGSSHICRVATKDCVTCHMPRLDLPGSHKKFTDHMIRIVKANEPYPD